MNKGMTTHSNTVYMFCNHPFELPCYAGIANVIREARPEMENILILDSMPYFRKTNVSFCFNYFDKVHRVGYCDYQAGPWSTAIFGIAKGFISAYRFSHQLRAIEINPNSFVFLITASRSRPGDSVAFSKRSRTRDGRVHICLVCEMPNLLDNVPSPCLVIFAYFYFHIF